MSSAYNKSDVEEFIKSAKQKKMTSFQVMHELKKFLLEKEVCVENKKVKEV